MEKIIVNPSTNIYTAMRGAGYNSTYAAIMECIDNSMEEDVNASFISVTVDYDKGKGVITKIYIADNGNSMNKEAANDFFSLGKSKRKKSAFSFGKYGMGGKTGCLSIGTKLSVYTKIQNGCVEKRVLDLDKISDKFEVDYGREDKGDISKDELAMFYEKIGNTEHGTLIVIENIDKIDTHQLSYVNVKNKYYTPLKSFDQKLIKEIAYTHTKNIVKYKKNILVCGQKVEPINYFGGEVNGKKFTGDLVGTRETVIDKCHIVSNVYDCKTDEYYDLNDYDIPANAANSGAYIFRNGRLVGAHLGLDFIKSVSKGDGHSPNVRYSVEVSGDADGLVNSSFIKAINSGDNFDERLKQFLQNDVEELIRVAKQRKADRIGASKDKKLEEDGKKQTKNIKRILKENPIKVETDVVKNKKKKETMPKPVDPNLVDPKPGGKTNNPYNNRRLEQHNKVDNSSWLDGITFSKEFYKWDDIFYFTINPKNGKYILSVNTNHPFYDMFISELDDDMLSRFLLFEMVQRLSIRGNDKITSDEKAALLEIQERIDEYRLELQNSVFNFHKSLGKDIMDRVSKLKNCDGVNRSSDEFDLDAKLTETDATEAAPAQHMG